MSNTVLTIAGFDPSSGAGITADLSVFAAHHLFGTACITALTVQNTLGVFATQVVATDTIAATLSCIEDDIPPSGIKIGMLATAEIVSTVAAFLSRIRQKRPVTVVLDPVLKSSSGKDLLDSAGIAELSGSLLPLVNWITPNLHELGALLGHPVHPGSGLLEAARDLQQLGRELNVVVTGGDLDPPDDVLVLNDSSQSLLAGESIQTAATHGTGCAFSSALLSRLIKGDDPRRAAVAAKAYVAQAMRLATPLGSGKGPLNLLWPLHTSLTYK